MPRCRIARTRARLTATRNNPFLFPSLVPRPPTHPLPLSQSRPHLAASLSRCYYVYNARRGGTPQKRLIDGARRRGTVEGSPPSSGPGGAQRRGENAFAEQTGRRDVNWNDGNSAIYFPSSFFANLAALPLLSCPRAAARRKLNSPFNTRVVRSSNFSFSTSVARRKLSNCGIFMSGKYVSPLNSRVIKFYLYYTFLEDHWNYLNSWNLEALFS